MHENANIDVHTVDIMLCVFFWLYLYVYLYMQMYITPCNTRVVCLFVSRSCLDPREQTYSN